MNKSTHYPLSTIHKPPMRRAFTLIEMIVAIAVGATLMSLAVGLLVALQRAERNGRSHVERNEAIQRLADRFRRDVHAAGDVAINGEDRKEWRFDLTGDNAARYVVEAPGISREERKESKVVCRESYALPTDLAVAVAVDRTASPPVVSLTIVPDDASMRPGYELRIDAVLGRDRRFAEEPKKEKSDE